jgi:hypothetical protein
LRELAPPAAWIFAAGLFLAFRYLTSPFGNRQTDMFVAAAVLGGCWLLAQRRDLHGALWLGFAAAIKCTPLLFAPYLLWRGRWLAASILMAAALVLNIVPDLIWPQTTGSSYFTQWREISLGPVRSGPVGSWFADSLRNQSISGVVGRHARFGLFPAPARIAMADAANATTQPAATKVIVYGLSLLLLGITLWRFGWRNPDTAQSAAQFSAVICLMLLLSPMTSKSHLCVLVLPSFVIARAVIERRTPGWIALGILLVLVGPLASRDLIGSELSNLTLAWGLPALFVFLHLVAMWILARDREPPVPISWNHRSVVA